MLLADFEGKKGVPCTISPRAPTLHATYVIFVWVFVVPTRSSYLSDGHHAVLALPEKYIAAFVNRLHNRSLFFDIFIRDK